MSGLRKYHVNKAVLFVTYSVEEGLLLLANPLIELILKSSLAHAQFHHPVRICHFLVEATHIHFIMVVDNPDDVDGFAERFKTETAHRINRLLGRRKRTIWCEGYDSPTLLTPEDVVDKIVYTYTNPAKDNLEDSIEKYPGLSSWCMRTETTSKEWIYIPRSEFSALCNHSLASYKKEAERLQKLSNQTLTFKLNPDAWMDVFEIDAPAERSKLHERINAGISSKEAAYRLERHKKQMVPLGKTKLISQILDLNYRPIRSGKRMWCICYNQELRKKFISQLKRLSKIANKVFLNWKLGDFSLPFPLGFYPPSMPKLASPLSCWD